MAGFFQLSVDREEDETSEATDKVVNKRYPNKDADLDLKKGVESGLVQPLSALGEYVGRKVGSPRMREGFKGINRLSKRYREEYAQQQTPEHAAAADATLFENDTGAARIMDDPVASITAKATEMVPSIIASAIPGTLLAKLGIGAVGVASATGATGSMLGAGDMAGAVADEIDSMSHEQLLKESKLYKHEIDNGASPQDAKNTIKEIAQDEQVPMAALVSFATNVFGPEAMLAKALGGSGVRKGLGRGLAEGAGVGALTEGIEGGTTAYGQEATGETYGGKDFSWLDVAKQATEEGVFGGMFGGAFGGLANVRGRRKMAGGENSQPKPKIEAVATGQPNAAEQVALAGAAKSPVPPPQPPAVTGSPPVNTPVGPPVVAQGAQQPPPGAKIEKTKRVYKKPEAGGGVAVVPATPPVGPDPAQAAAVVQQTPLVRRRAQAELAAEQQPAPGSQALPAEGAPPPVPETPPMASQPTPQVAQPTEPSPPAPAPEAAQPPIPPPLVLGRPSTGRVLPDLQAQERQRAALETEVAKPDDVAQRGTRYEQTEASVENPVQHAAWRNKMLREARRPDAGPIAKEVAKVRSTQGKSLLEVERKQLKDLHRRWLGEQTEKPKGEAQAPRGQRGKYALPDGTIVRTPEKYITGAIRSVQDLVKPQDRIEAFAEIMRNAPDRDEIRNAIRNSEIGKAATVVFDKIQKGTVKPEDIEFYEAVEKDAVAQTQEELDKETQDIEAGMMGGRGMVTDQAEADTDLTSAKGGIDAEIERSKDKEDAYEVTTKAGKAAVVEEGSESRPPSPVRKPTVSDEERARYVALATGRSNTAAASQPKPAVPKGGERVIHESSEDRPAKTSGRSDNASTQKEVVAKAVDVVPPRKLVTPEKVTPKGKKKLQNIAEARNEAIDSLGRIILDMRSKARDEARQNGTDSAVLAGLLNDIKNLQTKLEANFGKAAHDRVMRTVEAALTVPTVSGRRMGTSIDELSNLLGPPKKGETIFALHDDGTVRYDNDGHAITGQSVNTLSGAEALALADYEKMIANFARNYATRTSEVSSAIIKNMVPKILERTGDIKVHVVSEADWARLYPEHGFAGGFYVPGSHQIMVRQSEWDTHPSARDYIVLHEMVHAAFFWSIESDTGSAKMLDRILQEARNSLAKTMDQLNVAYSLKNRQELVAEIFSNPKVQRVLADIPISKELAGQLRLDKFKKHSLWSAVIGFVRQTLGLPRDYNTVLEAVLHVTNVAAGNFDNKQPGKMAADDDPFVRDMEELISNWHNDTVPINQLQPALASSIRDEGTKRVPRAAARSFMLNFTTLHQMTQLADKYFPKGMAVKVSDIVEQKRLYRTQLISEASDRVITRMHQLQKKYAGEQWEKFADLADRATSANVHPDVPLTDKRNKHVTKSFKWRFARAEHRQLKGQWAALPDDLKQVWTDARTYLVERQNQMALQSINNIVTASLGKADEQLARRIHAGTATEADRAVFKTNKALAALDRAKELKQIKGVYFPKMRRGDYVVTGEYKLPQWVKYQSKTDPDRYAFDDAAKAAEFIDDMRARGLTVTGSTTYTVETATGKRKYTIDPATGKPYKLDAAGNPVEYPFVRGDSGTHTVYDVTVQKKLVEFFESERAALEGERRLKEDPNYTINGVEKKLDQAVRTSHATSRQLRSAIKSMEQSAGWKRMSKQQRDATERAFMELSLSFVASTAPQNRARPRRNVLGASRDLTRNIAEYTAAAASSISNLEYMPQLEEAFDALDKHREDFRNQTSDVTLPRSQLLDAMRNNAYADDGTEPTKRNRAINALLALSFMDKLVSPAYHMINMLQPWMVSAPVLGGRHGFARSTYELGRAYQTMGAHQTLWSGVKDTKRAVTDLLEGTTDYMADLRKRMKREKDGAELSDMLDYLHDRGLIDKDAGLEVSELIQAGSRAEHYLHRVDHVVRQFGTAVEVMNRVTTAIAAYRMERQRGATHEEARVFAQESVANTQGNYSMSNAPRVFKHPLGRTVLQFKKFAQLQYFLMAKLAYNAFKGATMAERVEAAAGLTGMLVAHVAMAGFAGLPTEPIKLPWMLLSLFLPMPTWEEIEQKATDFSKSFLGDNLGDAVAHGLPRMAGIDLHSRVGLNSLILFGEPRKQEEESIKAWAFDTVLGAPFGLGTERIKGVRALLNGDFGDAAEKLAPFKILADAIKAYRAATEGKVNNRGEQTAEPSGLGDAIIQTFGFKPAGEARRQENTSAFFTQAGNRKKARQDLLDEFTSAPAGERAAVRRKILKYNAGVPKNARITMKSLDELLKKRKRDKQKKHLRKGVYGGKQNQDLLDKYIGD